VFGPVSTTLLYQRNETFNSDVNSVLYGATPQLTAVLAPQQLFGAPDLRVDEQHVCLSAVSKHHRAAW
jgi:hypothetical protein